MEEKYELVIAAASKVHENWCLEELNNFFKRALEHRKRGLSIVEALNKACYKGDKIRNEIVFNEEIILNNLNQFNSGLDSFENFMNLISNKIIIVKRFTRRMLTIEEQIKACENYKSETSEENILREFTSLSYESKKENLEAAIGAYNVYVEFSKAGITIEQMETDQRLKNIIGIAIHTDWLKRNKNHSNESLKVPFAELDKWTQSQDLIVFNALLTIVKQNKEKYIIDTVPGFMLPDYLEEEKQILKVLKRSKK